MNKRYLTLIITLSPTLLLAHATHGSGIMAGVIHPIFGIDHNVAIISSAILGCITNPKKWYILPFWFTTFMIAGGLVGIGNEATPIIEMIIAFSVLINGILIATNNRLPTVILVVLMTAIGFVHGYAHGAEMPEGNTALKYISGYVIGSTALILIGLAISRITGINKSQFLQTKTLIGGIVIGCGTMIILL